MPDFHYHIKPLVLFCLPNISNPTIEKTDRDSEKVNPFFIWQFLAKHSWRMKWCKRGIKRFETRVDGERKVNGSKSEEQKRLLLYFFTLYFMKSDSEGKLSKVETEVRDTYFFLLFHFYTKKIPIHVFLYSKINSFCNPVIIYLICNKLIHDTLNYISF